VAGIGSQLGFFAIAVLRGLEDLIASSQTEERQMSDEFIEEFNEFLAGEISAVETYELALKSVSKEDVRQALLKCQQSHSKRVEKLTACVVDLGGTPATSSGVWGPFAAFSQKDAASETDVIALLEESEAERLVQYEAEQKIVVSPVLEVLRNDLLRAQHETHLTMSSLLKSLLPSPQ
jgi:hypothetical protein